MVYGIHPGEMARMREHILQYFRELSAQWHGLLLSRDRKRKATELPDTSLPPISSSHFSSVLSASAIQPCVSINPSPSLPILSRRACVTVDQSSRSLQLLRSFYKDANATFRSIQQRAAVENVLYTNNDLFVILPVTEKFILPKINPRIIFCCQISSHRIIIFCQNLS